MIRESLLFLGVQFVLHKMAMALRVAFRDESYHKLSVNRRAENLLSAAVDSLWKDALGESGFASR